MQLLLHSAAYLLHAGQNAAYWGFFIKNCTEWIKIHHLEPFVTKKAIIIKKNPKNLLLHMVAYLLHTFKECSILFFSVKIRKIPRP